MLTENQIKEEISIAYIHAIAASLGYSCEKCRIDMDSIDVVIRVHGKIEDTSTTYSPEIKIQLKASSSIEETNGHFHFPLPIKNYNDLRANSTSPRLLVLLVLPELAQCLTHTIEELTLKKCAYWINLNGFPEKQNNTNVTVHIPSINVLSPSELKNLMLRASKEDL